MPKLLVMGGTKLGNLTLRSYLFVNLRQVRELSAAWLISYNEERPHDSLERIPPAEFRRQITGEVSTFKLCA